MPGPQIAFYITGHGFGHARRSAKVVRVLLDTYPGLSVLLRTTAPAWLFRDVLGPRVRLEPATLDPGAVEADPLTIDPAATAAAVRETLACRDRLVAAEAEALRRAGAALVLADIPFLAGPVAAAAGVPCIGISNFTWDWIYKPLFAGEADAPELLRDVARGYEQMDLLLRLPFSGTGGSIPRVTDVPLVFGRPELPVAEVLRRVGAAPDDPRKRVLVGMRGGTAKEALARAAEGGPDFLFLCPQQEVPPAPNLRSVELGGDLTFADLVNASDVVLAKLGWGIVADCIGMETPLLWPPRSGFREDEVTRREAPRFLRTGPISAEAFHVGDWAPALRALLEAPEPPERLRTDGAAVCARILGAHLGLEAGPEAGVQAGHEAGPATAGSAAGW